MTGVSYIPGGAGFFPMNSLGWCLQYFLWGDDPIWQIFLDPVDATTPHYNSVQLVFEKNPFLIYPSTFPQIDGVSEKWHNFTGFFSGFRRNWRTLAGPSDSSNSESVDCTLFPLVENDWWRVLTVGHVRFFSPNFWISEYQISRNILGKTASVCRSLPMTLYLPAFRCSQVESQSDSASPWVNVKLECCKSKWVLVKFIMFF